MCRRNQYIIGLVILLFPVTGWAQSDGPPAPDYVENSASWVLTTDLYGTVLDHPTQPLIGIPARFESYGNQVHTPDEGMPFVLVNVIDDMGNPETGMVSWDDAHQTILWEGSEALTVGMTYTVRIVIQNTELAEAVNGAPVADDIDVSFLIKIVDREPSPASIASLTADPVEDQGGCSAPQVQLDVTTGAASGQADYYPTEFYPAGTGAYCRDTSEGILCLFSDQDDAAEYCVDVTVTSLYDTSTDTQTMCVAASEFAAQDDGCTSDNGCDCQITSASSPASGPWMFLVGFLGLLGLAHGTRRRQQQRDGKVFVADGHEAPSFDVVSCQPPYGETSEIG